MAKSSTISLAQWFFLLLVIWISSYYAGVMTRDRLFQIPVEAPADRAPDPTLGWLPPFDEISERPVRTDLGELKKYAGKTVPEMIAEIRGTDSDSSDAVSVETLRFGEVKSEIGGFPEFRDRASEAGLELGAVNRINGSSKFGTFDLDGDGYQDVQTAAAPGMTDLQLYQNRADGRFKKVPDPTDGGTIPTGNQITAADFDNDGDLDLMVVRSDRLPNSLLENDGRGSFGDRTEAAGLLDFQRTASARWVDFDRDGWIDLFVAHYPESFEGRSPSCHLYHNEGDGTFREMGWETGLRFSVFVRDCEWGDFDGDGFADLALSTFEVPAGQDESAAAGDTEPAPLLLLRSIPAERLEDWRFESVAIGAGLQDVQDAGRIAFRDFDQDGALDLLAGGGIWKPFRLFRNGGNGEFIEVTKDMGIGEVTGVLDLDLADLDGDGFGELMLGTADPSANRVFWNRGGDSFRDATAAGGFGIVQSAPALDAADLDADGDLDVLIAADWTHGALLENPGFENRAWLTLDLEGSTANRAAIGARISLVFRDRDWILHRIERIARGNEILIGLGEAATIESLEIEWPVVGWPRSKFSEVPLNRLIRVREGDPKFEVIDRSSFQFGESELDTDDSNES